jgi:hypothetical protein
MLLVDAQVHSWGPRAPERPWPADRVSHAHRPFPLGDDELLREMSATGPVLAAARRPNIAVKASAPPCYTTEPYPFRNLHQHIRRAGDACGPQCVFRGTDLSPLPCPYRQAVTLFPDELLSSPLRISSG